MNARAEFPLLAQGGLAMSNAQCLLGAEKRTHMTSSGDARGVEHLPQREGYTERRERMHRPPN
jgi:hypothetical protein